MRKIMFIAVMFMGLFAHAEKVVVCRYDLSSMCESTLKDGSKEYSVVYKGKRIVVPEDTYYTLLNTVADVVLDIPENE